MTLRLRSSKEQNLVFVGTVMQVGAVSFPGVTASPRTLVAQVNAVLEKPIGIRLRPKDSVTIEVQEPSQFAQGVQAVFFAKKWVTGEGLAVREISHRIFPAVPSARPPSPTPTPVPPKLSDADLRARIAAADLVMAGQVVSVRRWTIPGKGRPPGGISEHYPDWREAVVRVDMAIKGEAGRQVVVRFPASVDVMWYRAPKLKEGEQWTFLLKRDEVSGVQRAMLGGAEVQAYTALDPEDVLPRDEAERLRALAARSAQGSERK